MVDFLRVRQIAFVNIARLAFKKSSVTISRKSKMPPSSIFFMTKCNVYFETNLLYVYCNICMFDMKKDGAAAHRKITNH